MSGTTDFMIWAAEKYGEDEDGIPLVGFERCWEFFADDLDDHIRHGRPDEFEFDLFLSYSWKDQERARGVASSLRRLGVDVWVDVDVVRQDGDRFFVWRVLRSGLRSSAAGIAFVTPNFFTSEWALHETRGMHRHGLLAAVITDGVSAPDALEQIGIDGTGLVVLDSTGRSPEQIASGIARIAAGPS